MHRFAPIQAIEEKMASLYKATNGFAQQYDEWLVLASWLPYSQSLHNIATNPNTEQTRKQRVSR